MRWYYSVQTSRLTRSDRVPAHPDQDSAPTSACDGAPTTPCWVSDGNPPPALPLSLGLGNSSSNALLLTLSQHSAVGTYKILWGLLPGSHFAHNTEEETEAQSKKLQVIKNWTARFSLRETRINNMPYNAKHQSQDLYLSM